MGGQLLSFRFVVGLETGTYLVEVFNHQAQVSDDCEQAVRQAPRASPGGRFNSPSTMTIRFRNPRKLGISVAS